METQGRNREIQGYQEISKKEKRYDYTGGNIKGRLISK